MQWYRIIIIVHFVPIPAGGRVSPRWPPASAVRGILRALERETRSHRPALSAAAASSVVPLLRTVYLRPAAARWCSLHRGGRRGLEPTGSTRSCVCGGARWSSTVPGIYSRRSGPGSGVIRRDRVGAVARRRVDALYRRGHTPWLFSFIRFFFLHG